MHKFFPPKGQDDAGRRAIPLQHRVAILCGTICLLASLALATLGGLSARYIVNEQMDHQGNAVARQIAGQVAPILATGNLIMLEVSLEQMRMEQELQQLSVTDLEKRPMGQAGEQLPQAGGDYSAEIFIDGNLAGELHVSMAPSASTTELQRMSLGLLALAVLLSVFAAVLGANWGQKIASRIDAVNQELSAIQETENEAAASDELESLESAVAALPLDLLKPPASASTSTANYRDAGLLFIHLDSLGQHVETLDEASLLRYTELHRHLIQSAAELYGGKLSVARQFGVLVSFDNGHNSGSPAFRASSCAWLIQHLAQQLSSNLPLRIKLSLACGLSETGTGSSQDIYPDLYNQYLVDELAELVSEKSSAIRLTVAVSNEAEVQNRCQLESEGTRLVGFMEPYCDLLERQQELVLRELERAG